MFENLRDAFHEAIANFKEELAREEVPGTVDRLFLRMKNELADAKRHLAALEKQIEHARIQVKRDGDDEATCRRRGEMARKVRDEETAHIAFEYAARYEQRRTVLERKVVALEDERVIRAVEFQEMAERLREAQGKRDTLAAAAGSSDSDETIRAADNLLEELDCLAGDMTDLSPGPRRTQEMDDIDREFRNLSVDPWPPIRKSEMDPNAVLE
jgi:phage shock protein A